MSSSSSSGRISGPSQNTLRNEETTKDVRSRNQSSMRSQRSQSLKRTAFIQIQDTPHMAQSTTQNRQLSVQSTTQIQKVSWRPQIRTVNFQSSPTHELQKSHVSQRPASSAPVSRGFSPTTSVNSRSTSPVRARYNQSTSAGTSRTRTIPQRRVLSNKQLSHERQSVKHGSDTQTTQYHQAPSWAYPKSFYRPTVAQMEKEHVERQQERLRRHSSRGYISRQYVLKFVHKLHDSEIHKFLHCIKLRNGAVFIATFCMVFSLLCFVVLAYISTKFSDWKLVYRNKMELLVFIMYHLVITMMLFVTGTVLTIGVLKESSLLLKICLGGLWIHLVLTWLGLVALAIFCTAQGYCFETETFPVLVIKLMLTVIYTGVWLYFIWTVNSYRRSIVDDESDDDDFSY